MKTTFFLVVGVAAATASAVAGGLSTSVETVAVEDGALVVQKSAASVPLGETGNTVFMVPEIPVPGQQEIRVQVVNTPAPPQRELVAALFVENLSGDRRLNVPLLRSKIANALADRGFRCIDPEDVDGVDPDLVADAAFAPKVGKSQAMAADCIVKAVATAVRVVRGGNPPYQTFSPVLSLSLSVKDNASGAEVVGEDVTGRLGPFTGVNFDANDEAWFDDLVREGAAACADAVAAKVKGRVIVPERNLVTVAFTCDVAGADLKVDGYSYGTTPVSVKVPAGIHVVEVSYPFCIPYKARANIQDGQRYNVSLQLTEMGRARYKDMTLFAETVDRIRKTGATDDYVRRALADGEAEYLRQSHFRWDGALQTLMIERDGVPPVVYGPTTTTVVK